jgi:hypothetical protein
VLPPEWQAPLCKDWFAVRAFVWSGITGFQVRVLPDRNCGCRESPCEPPGDFTSKRRRADQPSGFSSTDSIALPQLLQPHATEARSSCSHLLTKSFWRDLLPL